MRGKTAQGGFRTEIILARKATIRDADSVCDEKIRITEFDILIEYISRLVLVLKSISEAKIIPQWKN